MRSDSVFVGAICTAVAGAVAVDPAVANRLPRALPNAPSGYAPASVSCPSSRPTVRAANGVSPQESGWLPTRRNNTLQPMTDFLNRVNISGFDASNYVNSHKNNASALPNIGIAVSGGGYRALLNGGGALAAFDSRTPNATSAGQLGGVLQSATYLAGLSGGSWLVGSIFTNNYTSVFDLLNAGTGDLWDFSNSILTGPNDDHPITGSVDYYHELLDDVDDKNNAGFNTSITDYWGRALSYQLVNATAGGPSYTWSSLADQDFIQSGDAPLPILISDSRAPGQFLIPGNTTIFEFNPWEMGSWDPTVYGFAPMAYVGSNFSAGMLPDNESCINGFDNVGFVMGTSSTLFNEALIEVNGSSSLPGFLQSALTSVLGDIGKDADDISEWTPNPFFGYNPGLNPNADSKRLTLVDGGEDNENIPLHPLIQPAREVDVIFAVDSSADTPDSHYPNGTSLVATYERSLNGSIENGTAFPSVPGQQTFVNLGLNARPTFFGCNATNYTKPGTEFPGPLIVYLPNAPYIIDSGVDTFLLEYNTSYRNAILENGYDVATQANGTMDSQWPTCVACAMIQRSLIRTGTQIPQACNQCFDRYCWNGELNTTATPEYSPSPKLQTTNVSSKPKNAAAALAPSSSVALFAAIVAGLLLAA